MAKPFPTAWNNQMRSFGMFLLRSISDLQADTGKCSDDTSRLTPA